MSSPIITARNIGKKYQLGATLSHDTLRDNITYAVKGLFRRSTKRKESDQDISDLGSSNNSKEFWAIKSINFDVNQGEVIGIIGRNGAGKSTLLKILSQVTEPTEGEIHIKGRVASMLEVGTGFHPELSGRENIYMNGAILGMTRAEIKSKFDEIVTFAEVEKFIDTPVKRYSSGMKVRLAFAVAAYLEPEILVVDEVLAVGDIAFQKKCLGRMGKIATQGRTVLFVSHRMGAISQLCFSALLLEKGKIIERGDVQTVVSKYLNMAIQTSSGDIDLRYVKNRSGRGAVQFTRVITRNSNGKLCDTFTIGDDIVFDFYFSHADKLKSGRMSLQISSNEGTAIYHFVAYDADFELTNLNGNSIVRVVIRNQKLYPGEYYAKLWLADRAYETLDCIQNAFKFIISEGGSVIKRPIDKSAALVHEVSEWSIINSK